MVANARVVAIDVDPHAVEITRANAQRNGVAGAIDASTTPLRDVDGWFDVVVANVLLSTQRELGSQLALCARPGGTIVVSGMLRDQLAEVLEMYAAFGWQPVTVTEEDGWVAAVLHHPPK